MIGEVIWSYFNEIFTPNPMALNPNYSLYVSPYNGHDLSHISMSAIVELKLLTIRWPILQKLIRVLFPWTILIFWKLSSLVYLSPKLHAWNFEWDLYSLRKFIILFFACSIFKKSLQCKSLILLSHKSSSFSWPFLNHWARVLVIRVGPILKWVNLEFFESMFRTQVSSTSMRHNSNPCTVHIPI